MSLTTSFLLIRIDDRLIHGQVILGWGNDLSPKQYLIVDRHLASSPIEARLFKFAAPEETVVDVFSPEEFLKQLSRDTVWDRAILILRDISTLVELAHGGFRSARINLGGIHKHDSAEEVLPYLFLNPEDWVSLEGLAALGLDFFAQDLPGQPEYSWTDLKERDPHRAG